MTTATLSRTCFQYCCLLFICSASWQSIAVWPFVFGAPKKLEEKYVFDKTLAVCRFYFVFYFYLIFWKCTPPFVFLQIFFWGALRYSLFSLHVNPALVEWHKLGLPTSFSFRGNKITLVCHLYTFDALRRQN